jgi:hypothetical protein
MHSVRNTTKPGSSVSAEAEKKFDDYPLDASATVVVGNPGQFESPKLWASELNVITNCRHEPPSGKLLQKNKVVF